MLIPNVYKILIILLSVIVSIGSYADESSLLQAPVLEVSTIGIDAKVNWGMVEQTTTYTLFYAPYPYQGEQSIQQLDMGSQTQLNITLWDGAAFYIAIKASNELQSSDFSNIELLTIIQAQCANLTGQWNFDLTLECGGNQSTMSDFGNITQNNCQIEFTGSNGDTITGLVEGNILSFFAKYSIVGLQLDGTGELILQSNGSLQGSASTNLNVPGCSSTAEVSGIPTLSN